MSDGKEIKAKVQGTASDDPAANRDSEAPKALTRGRGAARPRGTFARSYWFWMWSKGVDMQEAIFAERYPEEDSVTQDLKTARERLGDEAAEVCNAARWNLSEYRKLAHITNDDLAKAIGVSGSALRNKLNQGMLTLKEFLALCATCLVDPCVVLGFVDSEDATFVRSLHSLAKASDRRAVGDLVEVLAHKQRSRAYIRKAVSPHAAADLGWEFDDTLMDADDDSMDDGKLTWAKARRELLPDRPLWWETDFDYDLFNEFVNACLHAFRPKGQGNTDFPSYEDKVVTANVVFEKIESDPGLLDDYRHYAELREIAGQQDMDGYDERAKLLDEIANQLYGELMEKVTSTGDSEASEEG